MAFFVESRINLEGEALTVDRALRRLEVERQRLSVRWCGTPGSFAGYDSLEVSSNPFPSTGEIVFTARMVQADDRAHLVELTATEVRTESTVIMGSGRTVAAPRGDQGDEAPTGAMALAAMSSVAR